MVRVYSSLRFRKVSLALPSKSADREFPARTEQGLLKAQTLSTGLLLDPKV